MINAIHPVRRHSDIRKQNTLQGRKTFVRAGNKPIRSVKQSAMLGMIKNNGTMTVNHSAGDSFLKRFINVENKSFFTSTDTYVESDI